MHEQSTNNVPKKKPDRQKMLNRVWPLHRMNLRFHRLCWGDQKMEVAISPQQLITICSDLSHSIFPSVACYHLFNFLIQSSPTPFHTIHNPVSHLVVFIEVILY